MKYLIRSLKYFAALCVLCIALMALMLATGTSAHPLDQTIYLMFHTDQYALLFGAIVVLSAFYPKFGFTVRRIEGDVKANRDQIVNCFRSAGFVLHSETDGTMLFRAASLRGKLMLLWEDEISVSQEGSYIVVDGIRRGVARIVYRLEAAIERTKND